MQIDESHFELGRVLGKGGFGEVTAVRKLSRPKIDTWFAMKKLDKTFIIKNNSVDEVFSELNLLKSLHNRFICNSHYAFQNPWNLYLVMDVAMGGDLRYHMTHKTRNILAQRPSHSKIQTALTGMMTGLNRKFNPFSEERARFYAIQIGKGLEYLHNSRVVHRDIKVSHFIC